MKTLLEIKTQPGSVIKVEWFLHIGASTFARRRVLLLLHLVGDSTSSNFRLLLFAFGFRRGTWSFVHKLRWGIPPVTVIDMINLMSIIDVVYVLVDGYTYVHIVVGMDVWEGYSVHKRYDKKQFSMKLEHLPPGDNEWPV